MTPCKAPTSQKVPASRPTPTSTRTRPMSTLNGRLGSDAGSMGPSHMIRARSARESRSARRQSRPARVDQRLVGGVDLTPLPAQVT